MSNSKWYKLFVTWDKSGIEIEFSEWSFIGSDHKEVHRLPYENELYDERFSDGYFQPFEYKWIESIYIPNTYRPISGVGFERKQDIEGLIRSASTVGKFPIFRTSGGIEIRGYEK